MTASDSTECEIIEENDTKSDGKEGGRSAGEKD